MFSRMDAVSPPARNCCKSRTAIAEWSPRSVRGSVALIAMARSGEGSAPAGGSARFNQPSPFNPGVPDSM